MRLASLEPRACGVDSLYFTRGAGNLPDAKQFILVVKGDLITPGTVENFNNALFPRIKIFGTNVKDDYWIFANTYITLQYYGIPMHIEVLDNVMRSIKYYIKKYLNNYEIDFTVTYREGASDVGK